MNGFGPSLAGVVGRRAAVIPGFDYTSALKNSGLTWDTANLDLFLTNAAQKVPGTAMAVNIASAADRANLITYLSTLVAATPAAPTVAAAEVPKYLDKGRKDPFTEVQLSATTGGLSVATTKLTGIVRGPRSVLALLETQEGIGYILKPGDTLGDGRLMEIGADSVVFAVGPKAGSAAQRVVLRLAAN